MKNLLFIIVILASNIVAGQESVPAANNYTETFSNYRAEPGSGNFVYNVPLFNIETITPDFNFLGNLYYNAQAASSIYTADGIMDRGWSANFLPSIYRDIEESGTFWDESYHRVNSADVYGNGQPYEKPERTNDLFQINVFGLRASFRLKYNSDNSITADLIHSNAYIEIIPTGTLSSGNGDAKIINLSGFTIKDGNGFTYSFNDPEESFTRQRYTNGNQSPFFAIRHQALDNPDGYNLYKRAFLLTHISDKYGRPFLHYIYKTYEGTQKHNSTNFSYNQKVIDYVNVVNKAKLVFTTTQSKVNSISINNYQNQLIQKINLEKTAIRFYNHNDQQEKAYFFAYYPKTGVNDKAVNNYGNYLNTGHCINQSPSSWVYDDQIQSYNAGLLRTITLPHKGKINIEYETNTYTFLNSGQTLSELNYEYIEVPVTYNSIDETYSFFYDALLPSNYEAYYVKFNSTLYTDPLLLDENGNPLSFFPGLQIQLSPIEEQPLYQIFAYENQCTYGEQVKKGGPLDNTTVILSGNGAGFSNISNVKVYKKTIKPENERINYCFGPSVRVKKITNIDHTDTVIGEKIYSYTDPANEKVSSGVIWHYQWYLYSDLLSPIFYRYVTEQVTGKGKTVYQMNMDTSLPMGKAKDIDFQPRNIWKYNDAGELIEHQNNIFETFLSSADPKSDRKIKKINSILKTYEGVNFNEIHTEKVFDTVSMHLVESKITEVTNGQAFKESYTYQKLGNAFYQIGVEKTKNNAALNQSIYGYQQSGSTQVYNLQTVSVAKESRPLEVEREITLYDGFGNVLEYKTKDGMVVSQIWGYNDSKLVAELKNVSYSSINNATITSIRTNSNAATYSESNLVGLLNGLRTTHTDGFITTWIYKPLIGITSVTDANGRKESYVYDSFNRLWRVFNHEGLIVKEYEYNIKN